MFIQTVITRFYFYIVGLLFPDSFVSFLSQKMKQIKSDHIYTAVLVLVCNLSTFVLNS